MTIHHDKMAYGRLASTREELSEDRLAQMLKKLNEPSEAKDEGKVADGKNEDGKNK